MAGEVAIASQELSDFAESDNEYGNYENSKLDPSMCNELILICSNVGFTTIDEESGKSQFSRGEDCVEWIHDLQRAIRRDNMKTKAVAITLGQWKVLQKKLIPLLLAHRDDWSLVFSILKVLVMLTMKPSKDSLNRSLQFHYLQEYKAVFLDSQIISQLVEVIVQPLSREGTKRTQQDFLVLELILTLIRNLLSIPNANTKSVTSSSELFCRLQEKLIVLLMEENVIDILLLVAQDIDSRENREWNLLLMEVFDLMFQGKSPSSLIESLKAQEKSEFNKKDDVSQTNIKKGHSLLDQINKENKDHIDQMKRSTNSTRHSNFGGTMTFMSQGGVRTVVTNFTKASSDYIPQATKKLKSKRKQKNIQGNEVSDLISANTIFLSPDDPLYIRLHQALRHSCDLLLSKCYSNLMNSLKMEFRRGSAKLVSTDRDLYFHFVWFLMSYHCQYQLYLLKKEKTLNKENNEKSNKLKGFDGTAILTTLDMFSFNFVLQSIEECITVKNFKSLELAVQLLKEMVNILNEMCLSSDRRCQKIAFSLQHKIFYERDFLDRLPALLKIWHRDNFRLSYLIDAITLTHLVLKILDTQGNIVVLSKRKVKQKKKKEKKKEKNEEDDEERDRNRDDEEEENNKQETNDENEESEKDEIEQEIARKETCLDAKRYFLSLVNHEIIQMYCYLLSNYATNSPKVNHYIYSFFYRIQNYKIIEDGCLSESNEYPTLEVMLFNINVLLIFNKILNDERIQKKPEFLHLLKFLRNVVRNFFLLSERNHLLYVEILFRLPYATRTCSMIQNKYREIMEQKRKTTYNDEDRIREECIPLGRKIKKRNLENEDLEGETEFDIQLTFNKKFKENKEEHDEKERKKEEEESDLENETTKYESDSNKSSIEEEYEEENTKQDSLLIRKWTFKEDQQLRKKYKEFHQFPDCFDQLALENVFQENGRTIEELKKRAFSLHLNSNVSKETKELPEKKNSITEDKNHFRVAKNTVFLEDDSSEELPDKKKKKKKLTSVLLEDDSSEEFFQEEQLNSTFSSSKVIVQDETQEEKLLSSTEQNSLSQQTNSLSQHTNSLSLNSLLEENEKQEEILSSNSKQNKSLSMSLLEESSSDEERISSTISNRKRKRLRLSKAKEEMNEESMEEGNKESREQKNKESKEVVNKESMEMTKESMERVVKEFMEEVNEESTEMTKQSMKVVNEESKESMEVVNKESTEEVNRESKEQKNEESTEEVNTESMEQVNEESTEMTKESMEEVNKELKEI